MVRRDETTITLIFSSKDGRHAMSASGEDQDPPRGTISQEDRDAIRRRSEGLSKRLSDVQSRSKPPVQDDKARGAAYGQAFRIVGELVAGLLVGGAIGWFIDGYTNTKPLFFAVFLMLGFAAGLMNVIRAARQMQAQAEPLQKAAPSVADDDDDDK